MRPIALFAIPLLVIVAAGCSQTTYRPHHLLMVTLPKHPLPPEAKTYRLVIEGESVVEPRLAAGIVVPGLERAECEVHTDIRVVLPAGSDRPVVQRGSGARAQAITEDVVVTVGIGFADKPITKVKERTSEDHVAGQPDAPHPVYAYDGLWRIPQKLVVVTKGEGGIEAKAEAAQLPFSFDRDPKTHAPFQSRGALQKAWAEAMPGLAMNATKTSAATFIADANATLEDDFLVRTTTIDVDLADEHKQDPRFAEAARAFDAANAGRLADPAAFPRRLAVPIGIWKDIALHPAGGEGDRREAIGAATYDQAVASFSLDQLDDADRLVVAAQDQGVDAARIGQLRSLISERRAWLAERKRK